MTEDQLEQEVLGWLSEVGYRVVCGYDVAPILITRGVSSSSRCC